MRLESKRLYSAILTIFTVSLLLTMGFIVGCGDEGDPPTDMVNGVEDPPIEETKVSYKDNIMPILAASCATANCHGAARAGGLDLSSYDAFKNGGNSGAAFTEGEGRESLVVKRINGSQQPQMPIGGPPLDGEGIQLFIDWINEGAENN